MKAAAKVLILICLSVMISLESKASDNRSDAFGLEFYAQTRDRDHRTSLVIAQPELLKLPKSGFRIDFDIALRNEKFFYGYISRFLFNENSGLDIISNIPDSKLNIVLTGRGGVINAEVVDTLQLKYAEWIHIGVSFAGRQVNVSIGDQSKTFAIPDRKITNPKFSWGVCTFDGFLSSDVAPMSVKDIKIRSLSGELLYYWPLDFHQDDASYDLIRNHKAIATNGNWKFDKYIEWEKVSSFVVDDMNPQVTYNDSTAVCYISADDKLYVFDALANSLNVRSVSGYPYSGVSSQMIFDKETKRIVSYTSENDTLRFLDITGNIWSGTSRHICSTCQHHNRFIDYKRNNLLSFGGYGSYRYNSDLRVMNLNAVAQSRTYQLDTLIYPRYLSALGRLNDDKILILGGYGSNSGIQEEYPQNYYDLYVVNLETFAVGEIWQMDNVKENFTLGNSLIADTLQNCIFSLAYDNNKYSTDLHLKRFDLFSESPGFLTVSSSIPYRFYDIQSYCDLFYHKATSSLFAIVIQEKDKKAEVSFFKLPYPLWNYDIPAIKTETSTDAIPGWILIVLILLFVLTAIIPAYRYSIKRFRRNSPEPITTEPSHLEEKPVAIDSDEGDKAAFNICLLGGFQAFDKDGNNITGDFTPTIRNLFLFLFLSSVNDGRGISSQSLDNTFWADMNEEKAKNNRNVNIRKLRLLLGRIESLSLSKQGMYWKLEYDEETFKCDYISVVHCLNSVKKSNEASVSTIRAIIGLASAGKLLPHIDLEWLDKYKSYYTTLLMETMLKLSEYDNIRKDNNLMLEISDVMLVLDNIDEDAIRLKCRTLFRMGKKGLSKQVYDKYVEMHRDILDSDPEISYEQMI